MTEAERFDAWVRAKFWKIADAHPEKVPLLKKLRKDLNLKVDIKKEYEEFTREHR